MRPRGQSWELRVFLSLEPGTGKKLYATKTVRGGKREAQQALAEMVTHAADGLLSVARASVGELLEVFAHAASARRRRLAHSRPRRRRGSSGAPLGGCGSAWSKSTARRSASRRCAAMWPRSGGVWTCRSAR